MRKYDTIIFDMDGLMFNTERFYLDNWKDLLATSCNFNQTDIEQFEIWYIQNCVGRRLDIIKKK
mgnify:CR=1 FL=1